MLRHWNLDRDPFDRRTSTYVPISSHEEAVGRLVDSVASGRRRVRLSGPSGCGKTVVLDRALSMMRGPQVRVARVALPVDGPSLFADLSAALGLPAGPRPTRAQAWRSLADACKLCRAQGAGVVLAIDDAADLEDRRDLERLEHADQGSRLTIIEVERRASGRSGWGEVVSLPRMTRSEADAYLVAKLGAAGRPERAFTPRAVARMHALAEGVARNLDDLGTRALSAGRERGLQIVGSDLIDLVAE